MGASAKTKQSSTSTYTPTAQASNLYTNIIDQATAAQSSYNPATAKTVAGFTDPQTQGFAQIAANQGAWQPGVTTGANMVNQSGQGIGAADISQFYNPYQNDVINSTLNTIGQQDAAQTRAYTASEAAQGGLGGNGFYLGKGRLQGDQAQARNNTVANLQNTGWQQALAAAQQQKQQQLSSGQASANIGQLASQLGYTDANAQLTAGNQQQTQQQNVNDAASQNALNSQTWDMQQAQWLAGIGAGIGPLTGGTTTGNGTATQSQGKGAGNVLGAGLTLAGMASDERVKENINEVGTTHDGQPIYSFRYKGDPRTQMGLMAQDVERGEHPEAVSQGIGGMKMVNYDRALVDAKADGGLALPQGLLGWSDIRPAQVRPPELPNVQAPQQQKDGFDPQASYDMGKKARAGIGSLFSGSTGPAASSPAGGAMAASGLQGYGDSGGIGGLSGLASLFGFADGGDVASQEEMDAIEQVESGGRDIVNPKSGAFGPRQIMPATAKEPGFGVRPLNPSGGVAEQRRFSDDYFNAMLARYGGDRDAARIAYNGGPRRADNWIKAGRDDSVIPQESADYYKKIQSVLGTGGANLVAKATTPAANGTGMGEPYAGKADRASGGMLKRMFGVEFNPLNLDENERKALMVAGLSMMSSGNVGAGGLAGMQYLAGAEAGARESSVKQQELKRQLDKDAADLALRTRSEDRQQSKDAADQTWRSGEVDRKNSELTNDQKEYEAAKKQGFTGDFQTFLRQQKSVTAGGASLPAEVGARIALGRVFTNMVPDLEKRINAMGATDYADLAMGRGAAAGIWRDIEIGREALIRGLTGAAMSQSEEQNSTNRYQITATDRRETMIEKVRNLKRHLEAAEDGAIQAKAGTLGTNQPTPVQTQTLNPQTGAPMAASRPPGDDAKLKAWAADAIRKGAPAATVNQRLQQWGVTP